MTIGKLEGQFTQDEATVVLNSLLESFSALAAVQIADREEREFERNLRNTQETEFEQALAADRDAARKREEEEAEAAEEESRLELEEAIRLSKEAEVEDQIRKKRSRIPEEPEAGPGTAKIAFVMPDGTRATRRFRHEDTVEVFERPNLLNNISDASLLAVGRTRLLFDDVFCVWQGLRDYVLGQLYDKGVKDEFTLKTSFPQATLTEFQKTVKEAGLAPSAQVIVSVDSTGDDDDDDGDDGETQTESSEED